MLLDGVHVPLTTPFYPDGRLYLRKLEYNVSRYSLVPVSGLIALGTASEQASLTDEEQRAVLRTVAEAAAPEKVLTAAINQAGCSPALQLADFAATLRYDVLLLAPPAHYAGDLTALLNWVRVIADRSALPCVVASMCGEHSIALEVLQEIAGHPQVLGILEQSNHLGRVADLHARTSGNLRTVVTTQTFTAATARMLSPAREELAPQSSFVSAASLAGGTAIAELPPAPPAQKTRSKQVGTQILWSHAADATQALRAGACGIAPAAAAAVPQAVFEIWAGWKDGDNALMREKQDRVAAIEPSLLQAGAPLLKAGAELSGYFGGRPRLPLVAPTAQQQSDLARGLHGMRS